MYTYKIAVETDEAWICANILRIVVQTTSPIRGNVEIVNPHRISSDDNLRYQRS